MVHPRSIRIADDLTIRRGEEPDVDAVLGMLDRATEWLVAQGREGQWGTEPHSTNPRRVATVTGWARAGGLYLACANAHPVGAVAVGEPPAHVPPARESELFVNLLVTDRNHAGRGIGGRLLAHARQLACQQGVELLRVDCYRSGDRALIRYYERQGFVASDAFHVELAIGQWPGQVLQQRLR